MIEQEDLITIAKACGFIIDKNGLLLWIHGRPQPFECASLNALNSLDSMQSAVLTQDEAFQRCFAVKLYGYLIMEGKAKHFHQLTVRDWQQAFVETWEQ